MEAPDCDRLRLALLDGDVSADVLSTEHVASCAACARAARTWPQAARALREMERMPAPAALDSAVVAALHAGVRSDRAVRALQQLARLSPPTELDGSELDGSELDSSELDRSVGESVAPEPSGEDTTAASASDGTSSIGASSSAEELGFAGRTPAPRVLDRLVHEELLDPSKALVRRHIGGLARLRAPQELATRVAAELARPDVRLFASFAEMSAGMTGGKPASGSAFDRRRAVRDLATRRVRRVFAAAALFALLALPFAFLSGEPQPRTRPFRVERADSFGALSPISRGLLNSASSGLIDPQSP